jgi:hypothetical protein
MVRGKPITWLAQQVDLPHHSNFGFCHTHAPTCGNTFRVADGSMAIQSRYRHTSRTVNVCMAIQSRYFLETFNLIIWILASNGGISKDLLGPRGTCSYQCLALGGFSMSFVGVTSVILLHRACGRTNLNYTGSSTRVQSRGLQRASNGIIPWPVG